MGCTERPGAGANGPSDGAPADQDGMVLMESPYSVDSTFARAERALESNEQITIMARIDHAANAGRVDLSLRPTRLLVFGNPRMGTPLMQAGQTAGIDLPQKMLIYEDAQETVHLAYNDPQYLAERHDITDREEEIETVSTALRKVAQRAVGQ